MVLAHWRSTRMEQRRDFIVPLQLLVTSEAVWEERSTREDSWLHSAGWLIRVIKRTRRRIRRLGRRYRGRSIVRPWSYPGPTCPVIMWRGFGCNMWRGFECNMWWGLIWCRGGWQWRRIEGQKWTSFCPDQDACVLKEAKYTHWITLGVLLMTIWLLISALFNSMQSMMFVCIMFGLRKWL